MNNADKEAASFTAEIRDLPGILHNLHLLTSLLEDETYDSSIRVYHLHSCYTTLEKVNKRLSKEVPEISSEPPRRISLAKLKWPFTSLETKELIAEIQRHKATLTLALSVDNLTALLGALGRQTDMAEGLGKFQKDTRKRWDKKDRVAMDQDRWNVLEFFSKVNPLQKHSMSLQLHHPGRTVVSVIFFNSAYILEGSLAV